MIASDAPLKNLIKLSGRARPPLIAALMCGFGRIIASIEWSMTGWVWVYNIVWMCALGGVRLLAERFASYRTVRQALSLSRLNEPLWQHAT